MDTKKTNDMGDSEKYICGIKCFYFSSSIFLSRYSKHKPASNLQDAIYRQLRIIFGIFDFLKRS